MIHSNIKVAIESDDQNMPERISWAYDEQGESPAANTDAVLLSVWDKHEKRSLHVDLWTKDMTMSEMHQLVFQTMATLADTYQKATGNTMLAGKMQNMLNQLEKELSQQL